MNKRLCFSLLLSLLSWSLASAEQDNAVDQQTARPDIIELAPLDHIYSPYLADQQRVTFGLQFIQVTESDIPETGINRFALRMGGRLELFNWTDKTNPVQQLQANLEVGFRGHFDINNSQDNIGWDGNYGLIVSYRQNETLAYRLGLYHNSSHLGDEYAERTGRKRISYTREEFLLGGQLNLNTDWQYYLEVGIGYHQDEKPLQERYRGQMGIQYQQHGFSEEERLGWYAGLDITAYEENDWALNRALQVGFAFRSTPHVWRLAIDYYRGRSTLGEFFQHEEEYAGVSLYLDI